MLIFNAAQKQSIHLNSKNQDQPKSSSFKLGLNSCKEVTDFVHLTLVFSHFMITLHTLVLLLHVFAVISGIILENLIVVSVIELF